jgi:hypothetical protein
MIRGRNVNAFVWSSALAFVLVMPGLLVLYDLVDIPWSAGLEFGMVFLIPGGIPALLLAIPGVIGTVHDPSPAVMILLSYPFWLFVTYKAITLLKKRGTTSSV